MAATIAWRSARGTNSRSSRPRGETRGARDVARAALAELARLDDAGFRALFAKSAVKRIGRARFVRNVLIAIGNSGDAGAGGAKPSACSDDPSPLVRGAAIWALGRLDRARLERRRERATRRREADPTSPRNGKPRAKGDDLMATLICFGFGYCAEHFIGSVRRRFERIVGTVRGAERAAVLNAYDGRTAPGAGLRRRGIDG
jgi:hypothetical protein